METEKKIYYKDKLIITGMLMVVFSFCIYLLPEWNFLHLRLHSFMGIFSINYVMAIVYLVIILAHSGRMIFNKAKREEMKNEFLIEKTFIVLILFFISCFSLNRELPIFGESASWLKLALIVMCLNLILLGSRNPAIKFPGLIMGFILGISLLICVYFSLFLLPFYPIGLVGIIALGIGIHVFIPLVLVIFQLIYIVKLVSESRKQLIAVFSGIIIGLVFIIVFVSSWNHVADKINTEYDENILQDKNLYPAWVRVSMSIKMNNVAKKYLETGLVYQNTGWSDFFRWDFPHKNFGDRLIHDPLVVIASLTGYPSNLNDDEKIKILESSYHLRHQGEERLWSGEKLTTSSVITNARIFPEYRMAYTEKIISIQYKETDSWQGPQEAIYSFYLPEGSAVSALSLWINGKEEKARLTTKHKADTAYKTIVGIEARDPSVVHWNEGNRISVRVFPCIPNEIRRFKIGITSPLLKKDNKLVYKNITFEGPSSSQSRELDAIDFTTMPVGLTLPKGLKQTSLKILKYSGKYRENWEISMNCPELNKQSFAFDSNRYQLEEKEKIYESFQPANIYLDINGSWTKKEFDEIWNSIQTKNVYAWNEGLIRLNPRNKDEVFETLNKLNFSIFPLYEIEFHANSLFISKGVLNAPSLADLKDSKYSQMIIKYFSITKGLKFFNLGDDISPYLSCLKELRVFDFDSGRPDELAKMIRNKVFIKDKEDENTVIIPTSNIKIVKSSKTEEQGAPDHLLRLFTYNDIMKKINVRYLNSTYHGDDILNEAAKGFVVTPVSSLVVLESQQDYTRFGIEKNTNSLLNASKKSSGAVPEPGEWVLIGFIILTIIYLWKRPF